MSASRQVITCDHCGEDITVTGNCEDYRLVLESESRTPWYVLEGKTGGFVTAMAMQPPISRPHHFCGFRCLKEWAVAGVADDGSKAVSGGGEADE